MFPYDSEHRRSAGAAKSYVIAVRVSFDALLEVAIGGVAHRCGCEEH